MKRMFMSLAVTLLAMLVATQASFAVNIAVYEFGTPGDATFAATSSATGVAAGDFTNDSLGQFETQNLGYATQPVFKTNPSSPATTDVATEFGSGNVHSFTLTPAPGKMLKIDSLDFDVARGGGATPRNYGVRTDLTGATDLSSGPVTQQRSNFMPVNVDLSGESALQYFSTPVTFQFATATGSTGRSLEWDNFVVQGSVLEELVRYDFNNTAARPASNEAPSSVADGVLNNASLSINPAGNLEFEISNPSPNYATQPVLRVFPGNNNDLSEAVANDGYFEFTVAPKSLHRLTLDSLAFDAGRGGGGTPRGWALFSSADGYAAPLGGADIPTQRPNFTAYSVNLTGGDFNNLDSPTTFRLYVYSPGDGSTVEFDNLRLIGAAEQVPEPTTAMLALLAAAPLTRRRRRA